MSRPGDKPNWINDNTTGIEVPTPAEQDAGWDSTFTSGLKPPRQWFNWFQNRVVQWVNWFSGQSGEYIVIDSTAGREKERDYETLADYIADSPSVGDKVLVKTNQVLTAQMIIPDNITLKILDGVDFTRSTLDAASVIKFGNNWIIEGILNLVLSQTGTTAKGIEIDGDSGFGDIIVENSSTGTLTDVFAINAAKGSNYIRGIAKNTGGGVLTNVLADSSAENSNNVTIVDEPNTKIERSDGIIFERNIRDISRNLVIENTTANPTFQMDIDADEIVLQNSSSFPFIVKNVNETVDITVSGVNGLDTGSEAADTWYAVHVITDSSGTEPTKGMFSLSDTAPTMPSGYDVFRRVGWIKNDASSNFMKFIQTGKGKHRIVWYDHERADVKILNEGTATAMTVVDCSAFIPPTATEVIILGHFKNGAAGASADMLELRLPGSTVVNPLYSFRNPFLSDSHYRYQFGVPVSSSQTVEYSVSNATNNAATLHIIGYKDEL